jgi:hypothetical protein
LARKLYAERVFKKVGIFLIISHMLVGIEVKWTL